MTPEMQVLPKEASDSRPTSAPGLAHLLGGIPRHTHQGGGHLVTTAACRERIGAPLCPSYAGELRA